MKETSFDLEALMAAVERGESLPPDWYTESPSVDAEVRQIFLRTWQYVGALGKLGCAGDHFCATVADVPVVVVRRGQNLVAFVNTSRHGRRRIIPDDGNAHSIRVETLGPFVFVNLDRQAAPLLDSYPSVLSRIARSGIELDALQPWGRCETQGCANWKTEMENYLECYHCCSAHPGFSSVVNTNPHEYTLAVDGLVLSQTGHVQPRISASGGMKAPYEARGRVTQAQYHLLWPNATININPGFPNLSIGVSYPAGPHGTWGFSDYYFGPGVTRQFARELIAFDDVTSAEDQRLTGSVQRALLARLDVPTRVLATAEQLVIEFQKLVVKARAHGTP